MPRTKSNRSKKIESMFEMVRVGVYKCTVDACHVEVHCNAGFGGRASHLRIRHKTEYDELPAAAKRARGEKPKEEKEEGTTDEEAPATQPKEQEKRQPTITQGMVIEFLARNVLPFSLVEDKLFRALDISRRNVAELMATRLAELKLQFRDYVGDVPVAMCIDSGTNVQRTLNITVVFNGVGRVIASERIDEHTIPNLTESIVSVVDASGLKFGSFVSDNASNVKGTCCALAKKYRCIASTCGCHGLNLFVKKMLYEFDCVAAAREVADKIRSAGENVPNEISTRWLPAYNAVEHVSKNKHRYIAEEMMTRAQSETVEQALSAMKPFLYATRKCDSDESTIFDVVTAVQCLNVLPQGQAFNDIFARNIWSDALVLACVLSPHFVPEQCTPPIRSLIEATFLDVCTDVDPGLDDKPRRLRCELASIMEGHLQRGFRLSKEKQSVEEFWNSGCTPITYRVLCLLRTVPSSSSSVERSFSAHARLHTWLRNGLCEESVRAQLGLHTFLKHEEDLKRKMIRIEIDPPNAADIEKCLLWCFFAWSMPKANALKEGDSVLVWFKGTGLRESAYKCKLLEKIGSLWRVRWQSDASSTQRFDPDQDTWQLQTI